MSMFFRFCILKVNDLMAHWFILMDGAHFFVSPFALVVNDYDEAIQFYIEKLNFKLVEDTVLSETKRWVLISPPGPKGCCLLLAKAANDEQGTRIGNQTGGRVFLFLQTDNFQTDFDNL